MVIIVCVQDDPRVDLQCSETLHGDEPEAVRRLHPTVQGREKQVSDNRAVQNLKVLQRSHSSLGLLHSHQRHRKGRTNIIRIGKKDYAGE